MSASEVIVYLVIAAFCGAVARVIAGGTTRGFILSVMVGFLGAFIGHWMARAFHVPALYSVVIGGHPFPIVWSILGGIALVVVGQILMRPSFHVGHWQVRH
jgi:uncharacterized membrane protein YeaQ/YmgE (transglycosylase-associated protein family)